MVCKFFAGAWSHANTNLFNDPDPRSSTRTLPGSRAGVFRASKTASLNGCQIKMPFRSGHWRLPDFLNHKVRAHHKACESVKSGTPLRVLKLSESGELLIANAESQRQLFSCKTTDQLVTLTQGPKTVPTRALKQV
eukprot:4787415-Amphidinium_carterae.1